MKALSLLFHDVVRGGDYESSGFPGEGAKRYKLSHEEFASHLASISQVLVPGPKTVWEVLESTPGTRSVMLTFDDGGISAYPGICDSLDRYGWKGHFFITTDFIGKPTFVSENDIRAIRQRGHIVGSHSSSHPERMSSRPMRDLLQEWGNSVKRLSDILGEPVTTASVPNGYYSGKVAEAASLCGVKVLFTSEPDYRPRSVEDCTVFGRYIVQAGMGTNRVARLVEARPSLLWKEFVVWNTKKALKVVAGDAYLKLRIRLLRSLNT
jgi:peptidoglycan/xylan/chitin deacetylase (PgdA/CDA1 family)